MSSFFIFIIACMTRLAFASSGSERRRTSAFGVICQETPKRSLIQPQGPTSPPPAVSLSV